MCKMGTNLAQEKAEKNVRMYVKCMAFCLACSRHLITSNYYSQGLYRAGDKHSFTPTYSDKGFYCVTSALQLETFSGRLGSLFSSKKTQH